MCPHGVRRLILFAILLTAPPATACPRDPFVIETEVCRSRRSIAVDHEDGPMPPLEPNELAGSHLLGRRVAC